MCSNLIIISLGQLAHPSFLPSLLTFLSPEPLAKVSKAPGRSILFPIGYARILGLSSANETTRKSQSVS